MAKLKMDTEITSRAQCKATLNSVADALYVIGGKWKLRIIVALTEGNSRFNALQRLTEAFLQKCCQQN
ncbi:MAG TPA: winged helix-turn-helix transcriptional regulator [Segetibacter sp.]